MASGIDALVISKDEKTFQFQDDLAPLPVPDLDQTLSKYLDSVKPFVTDEELRQVEFLCQQFASGEGKILHNKLQSLAQKKRNWLETWWEEVVYMEGRLPNPLINMTGPGPYVSDVWKPRLGTKIPRSALMLHYMVHFWLLTRREQIRPHKDAKGRPLCMNQFHQLFNTCKVPGVHKDHLVHYFKTESEGPAPSHVVVMCKGHVFSMQCVDEAGAPFTAPEYESQLQKIVDRASSLPPAPGVGYFTSLERTKWAQIRSHLLAVHPENFHSLRSIEESIVAIGLDDYVPKDQDDLALNGMFGDPKNKWFDKSMNFVTFEDGTFVSNCDHSPVDGMMLVSSTYYVHCKLVECGGKWKGPTGVRKLPEPKHLQFHLDTPLMRSLQDAKNQFAELSSRVEVKLSTFTGYGKKYLKTQRVHPDTCVQLALQLTYYKMHNKHAPTYETATIRRYYHGRTETMRSCTPEACKWCRAMSSKTGSEFERRQLFMSAVDKHNRLMEEATNLQGCDRHLFGLAMVAHEEGLPMPQLFQHPAYVRSGGGGNFVLSTSCIGYTTVFGGVAPMCPHGYGVFYNIRDDKFTFYVSAWTADQDTSSKKFIGELHQVLVDIRNLLDNGRASAAHL